MAVELNLCFTMWMVAAVLAVLIRTGHTKTSYLRYVKDVPFCTRDHQYLTTISCKTGLQCAVGCVETNKCILVDVQSGHLYKDFGDSTRNQKSDAQSEGCSKGPFIVYKNNNYTSIHKGAHTVKTVKTKKKRDQIFYLSFRNPKGFTIFYPKNNSLSKMYGMNVQPKKIAFFTVNSVMIAIDTSIIEFNLLNGQTDTFVKSVDIKDIAEGENDGVVYVYGKEKNNQTSCLWRIDHPKTIAYKCYTMAGNVKMVVYAKEKRIYFASKMEIVTITFMGDVDKRLKRGLDLYLMTFDRFSQTVYFMKNKWLMSTNLKPGDKKNIVRLEESKNKFDSFAFHNNTIYYCVKCMNPITGHNEYCLNYTDIKLSKTGTIKRYKHYFFLN